MAVSQLNQSFQNDGNFSQLDLGDTSFAGATMRIETFRCSQPEGVYGVTAAGTSVASIAGGDHLSPTSNRIFRHVFSVGRGETLVSTLEIRETFEPDGSMDVRMRDIDADSPSFGAVVLCNVSTRDGKLGIHYEIRQGVADATPVSSPLVASITQHVPSLIDLSESPGSLGDLIEGGTFNGEIEPSSPSSDVLDELANFSERIREKFPKLAANVKVYERMGDFRDKCIHSGVNLTGPNPALASEFILVRAYRISLITMGRLFDDEMSAGGQAIDVRNATSLDTKPGVYSSFLAAYSLNIGMYQLGLDKVHSDYGGIPMSLSPGSRLENGAVPLIDATSLNKTLALLAAIFYLPAAISQITSLEHGIMAFNVENPE